jgi:hypothetical protein
LLQVELPFFSRPVNAYPFLSAEAERLAQTLGLVDLSWYNVFEGEHVLAAIGRFQAPFAEEQRDTASSQLAKAAELDLFGQAPSQLFVFQLEGDDDNHAPVTRTLLLRAKDSYELTGTVVALAVAKVLMGTISLGVQFAMDALDPADTLEHLRHSAAITAVEFIGGGAEGILDEGVL